MDQFVNLDLFGGLSLDEWLEEDEDNFNGSMQVNFYNSPK